MVRIALIAFLMSLAVTAAPACLVTAQYAGCCKVCSVGKACGDSCINAAYTCHKGPGCACDASAHQPNR